ncbi:DUF3168 domain-containing protein [Cupriavidus sp. YAF13]|uniref:DUF3168 domain-containing protein n=1 Tax=Cupriavidus sp. YAF13 TaxID=3233075 RepID=UPI003F92E663
MASAHEVVAAALGGLVGGRIYPGVAQAGVARPYITYVGAGGQSVNVLGDDGPVIRNARIQVNVWSDTEAEALRLMNSAIAILVAPPIRAVSIGAPVDTPEPATKLYGSRQDFSIWFNP